MMESMLLGPRSALGDRRGTCIGWGCMPYEAKSQKIQVCSVSDFLDQSYSWNLSLVADGKEHQLCACLEHRNLATAIPTVVTSRLDYCDVH